jgi:hypothetical protein
MSKMGAAIKKRIDRLPKELVEKSSPAVLAAVEANYPPENIRTGAARQSFVNKSRKSYIKIVCGVHKKKSKSGKRRKSKSGNKVNYAQFIPGIYDHRDIVFAILGEELSAL